MNSDVHGRFDNHHHQRVEEVQSSLLEVAVETERGLEERVRQLQRELQRARDESRHCKEQLTVLKELVKA